MVVVICMQPLISHAIVTVEHILLVSLHLPSQAWGCVHVFSHSSATSMIKRPLHRLALMLSFLYGCLTATTSEWCKEWKSTQGRHCRTERICLRSRSCELPLIDTQTGGAVSAYIRAVPPSGRTRSLLIILPEGQPYTHHRTPRTIYQDGHRHRSC